MALTLTTDLELSSPAFRDGEFIPALYTCDGDDISPPLAWRPATPDTRSLALIVEDPDAPNRIWSHWAVFNLPPTLTGLDAAVPQRDVLENGARQGVNDFGQVGYSGPSSPEAAHRYAFRLFALNALLLIPPRFSRGELLRAMAGRILEESRLTCVYQRRRAITYSRPRFS